MIFLAYFLNKVPSSVIQLGIKRQRTVLHFTECGEHGAVCYLGRLPSSAGNFCEVARNVATLVEGTI